MYNNGLYYPNYNPQVNVERINNQIAELEKMKQQIQQPNSTPTNLTQNFQFSPSSNSTIKYANSIDEVQKDFVIGDTPYFSKDMSIVWIKNTKGEIRSYELNEIVEKDEKDIQIALLQSQIDELKKGMMNNEQLTTDDIPTEVTTNTTRNDEPIRTTIKENKSTSVQRVSTSKKK